MASIFKAILITGALTFATASLGQETDETQTAPEPPTEQAAPAAPSDLSTGVEIGDEVGKTYIRSEHGDWELRCVKVPEGQQEPCQIYQLLNDDSGNSVAEINLFELQGDNNIAAGATIITPLETLLTANMRIAVDGAKARVYPFTFCAEIGCFARIGLTGEEVAAFKGGQKAVITIVPVQAPDQEVALSMSLNGFTAAFEAVTEANAPAQ